jgi:autotransporter-associated beta strand protein
VQQGGALTIEGGSLSGGTVTAGAHGDAADTKATNGAAYGAGIFIQGNQTVTFAPPAGKTLTISDVIADQTGSHDASGSAGSGTVIDSGAGTVVLSGGNTYTGGTTISGGGTLELAVSGAAGSGGIIAFGGSGGTLQIDGAAFTGSSFSNTINQFALGDVLDLRGLAFASGATAQYNSGTHILTVSAGGVSKQLTLTNPTSTTFATPVNDGSGGTQVTIQPPPPPSVSTDASAAWTEGAAPATVSPHLTITDSGHSTLVSATVAITSGAFAGDGDVLGFNTSGTSISGSYSSATETLTLSGTDTVAHYQSVLESVTFSAAANPTDFGADPSRTVTFAVSDVSSSGSGTTTVNITPTTIYVTSGHTSSG